MESKESDDCIESGQPDGCSCFKCKIKTLQFPPSNFPSRTRRVDFRPKEGNSWEKGTVKDERGMPLVHAKDMSPIGVKEYAEKRHHYEQARRDLHNSVQPDGC